MLYMNNLSRMQPHEKLTLALMVLILALVAFVYYLRHRTPDIINYPTDREVVVAFGDSLIEGVGSTNGEGFIDDLEDLINRDIVNLGVSGDTTTDGLERIEDVLERDPGLVIISLGGNDFLQRVPEEQVEQNFNKIISKIQNNGSMVMLLAVPGYGDLYENLSEVHQTAYVSNILRTLLLRSGTYMSDPIHPNDAGYTKIAERIAPLTRKILE